VQTFREVVNQSDAGFKDKAQPLIKDVPNMTIGETKETTPVSTPSHSPVPRQVGGKSRLLFHAGIVLIVIYRDGLWLRG